MKKFTKDSRLRLISSLKYDKSTILETSKITTLYSPDGDRFPEHKSIETLPPAGTGLRSVSVPVPLVTSDTMKFEAAYDKVKNKEGNPFDLE